MLNWILFDLYWHPCTSFRAFNRKGSETSSLYPSTDYDKVVKELVYEKRARPTDRLQTEEELLMQEQKKLIELEKDRVKRMIGETVLAEKTRDTQGDDLGDDEYEALITQMAEDEEAEALVYHDGKLMNDKILMAKPKHNSSDIESLGSESGSEEEDEESGESEVSEEELQESEEELQESENELQEISSTFKETTQNELPYSFSAPTTYTEFLELMSGKSAQDHSTLLDRLRVLYPIRLAAENKEIMHKILQFTIKYCDDILDFDIVKALEKNIIDIAKQFPEEFGQYCLVRLQDIQSVFNKRVASKKKISSTLL